MEHKQELITKGHKLHEYVYLFPELDAVDYTNLKNDIMANGLIMPIVMTHDKQVIDGRHRLTACQEIPVEPAFVVLGKDTDLLSFVISANDKRRQMTPSQRAMLALKVKEIIEKEEAFKKKERVKKQGKTKKGTFKAIQSDVGNVAQERPRDKAAMITGVSGRLVQSAAAIAEQGTPQDVAEVAAGKVTVSAKEKEIKERKNPGIKSGILLSDWDKKKIIVTKDSGELNKQTNESIDWAKFTWNPITGCLHGCDFCYARDIANTMYTHLEAKDRFSPVIYPHRLGIPINRKPSKKAETDVSYKNIFTCSMADLFGKWVPRKWIEAVFDTMRASPQWNFLLLTKFPQRYVEFDIPKNAWVGATVNEQKQLKSVEKIFSKIDAPVKWLSLEPMYEPIVFNDIEIFDWLVVGGASKSTKTPAYEVPFEQQIDIYNQAVKANVKIYFKSNIGRPKGFPHE